MKTLTQIANELGVSRAYIYQVVKLSNTSLDNFTTGKRGKQRLFDEEAEKKLKLLFTTYNRDKNNLTTSDNQVSNTIAQDRQEELSHESEELLQQRARNEELQQELERLRASVELLQNTVASLSETLRMKEKRELLPAEPANQPHKKIGKIKTAIRKWLEI